MKWLTEPISGQNLYLKLAIFLTGLVTGLESSLRQLISQFALFLVFLLLEPVLYGFLLKALRRVLPFLAGYWIFVTIFSQDFPDSVFFSLQILYLLLISVYVFGGLKLDLVARNSAGLRRLGFFNSAFFYLIATYLYLKSFFRNYAAMNSERTSQPLAELMTNVLNSVAGETETIRNQVHTGLSRALSIDVKRSKANFCGLLFLSLLVLLHSL